MKMDEINKMKDQELDVEVKRMRDRLFELRSQAITEKLENPRKLGIIRKDIARLLTEKQARQIQQESVA